MEGSKRKSRSSRTRGGGGVRVRREETDLRHCDLIDRKKEQVNPGLAGRTERLCSIGLIDRWA